MNCHMLYPFQHSRLMRFSVRYFYSYRQVEVLSLFADVQKKNSSLISISLINLSSSNSTVDFQSVSFPTSLFGCVYAPFFRKNFSTIKKIKLFVKHLKIERNVSLVKKSRDNFLIFFQLYSYHCLVASYLIISYIGDILQSIRAHESLLIAQWRIPDRTFVLGQIIRVNALIKFQR